MEPGVDQPGRPLRRARPRRQKGVPIDSQPRRPKLEDIVRRAVNDVSTGRGFVIGKATSAEIDAMIDFLIRAVDTQVARRRKRCRSVRAGNWASLTRVAVGGAGV